MICCPTPEIFEQFLDELLNEPELQQVKDHLESCPRCQQTVHRLIFNSEDTRGGTSTRLLDSLVDHAPPPPIRRLGGTPVAIEFPEPATPQGPRGRLGVYHIQEEIGSGTYGVVFRAYDEKLQRLVALKVLRPELATRPNARVRFESEARAAAKINHPHVIVIHAVSDGTPGFPLPYIAMEFVDGMPLHAHLRAQPHGLSAEEAARLAQQVARGLAAAHGRGVVHRDVKPENILLRRGEDGWQVKLTDFGIAQVVEEARLRSPHGSVIGTPHYMSPEAFLAPEAVDGRSDIYSLGVTLYQLLTKRLPFEGSGAEQLQREVVKWRFDLPRRLNPKVPADLEAIVLKCMAKEPERRYETAADLAEELKRWTNHQPVGAYSYNSGELLALGYRRNRLWAVVLLAMLAIVLIIGLWQQDRDRAWQESKRTLQEAITNDWNGSEKLLGEGRFGDAAEALNKAIGQLEGHPDLVGELDRQNRLEARCDLFHRRDEFQKYSDQAWFFAGEERGEATRVACEKALACYGVLNYPDWRTQAPLADLRSDELPAEMAATVEREVHRLLLLLSALYVQQGILAYRPPLQPRELGKSLQSAPLALDRARKMETAGGVVLPSRTTAILEKGVSGLERKPHASEGPARADLLKDLSAEDCFFLGVMHVYLAKYQKDDQVAQFVKLHGPKEFDYDHPRQTAVELLRRAVQLEPWQYWSCFMLGRILAFPGPDGKSDDHEAVGTFNICVTLRPKYSRGYEQRALTLVRLSLETPDKVVKEAYLQDAVKDLNEAIGLAPDDPSTYWVRGQAFDLLNETSSALAAYTRALKLEDHLQDKVSRRNQLEGPKELVKKVLHERPADRDALQLRDLINRASKL